MGKILKKLHSQRGETMLMALLLFLVGVMVSAVILAAAISAESDAKAAREEQQAYLTVSSAAELFRDAIQSGSGGYRDENLFGNAAARHQIGEAKCFRTVQRDF